MDDEPSYDDDDDDEAADWWQQQDNEMQRYEHEVNDEIPREKLG